MSPSPSSSRQRTIRPCRLTWVYQSSLSDGQADPWIGSQVGQSAAAGVHVDQHLVSVQQVPRGHADRLPVGRTLAMMAGWGWEERPDAVQRATSVVDLADQGAA
jgi:hypothetical protein